jgi:ubiquinone/menaquinone biosynthesis C-methylase UbiE
LGERIRADLSSLQGAALREPAADTKSKKGDTSMTNPFRPHKDKQPGTYFVRDRQSQQEMLRLTLQDRMITAAMGGVLPEQPNPASIRHVLDIGCGTGGWMIEAAQSYPMMSLVGVDISQRMVEHARKQAVAQQVAGRVTFQVMDALVQLEFPSAHFDLVNLRLGVSYIRTWDWPKVLSEIIRVTLPGGIVRITDNDIFHQSNSPALTQLDEIAISVLYRAGHLFEQVGSGLTAHLAGLLEQHGCQHVQTKAYALKFQAGTTEGQAYYEDMAHVFQTTRPFIRKWGCEPENYDDIYQRALEEMQKPTFHSTWNLLSTWGQVPGQKLTPSLVLIP